MKSFQQQKILRQYGLVSTGVILGNMHLIVTFGQLLFPPMTQMSCAEVWWCTG